MATKLDRAVALARKLANKNSEMYFVVQETENFKTQYFVISESNLNSGEYYSDNDIMAAIEPK